MRREKVKEKKPKPAVWQICFPKKIVKEITHKIMKKTTKETKERTKNFHDT